MFTHARSTLVRYSLGTHLIVFMYPPGTHHVLTTNVSFTHQVLDDRALARFSPVTQIVIDQYSPAGT